MNLRRGRRPVVRRRTLPALLLPLLALAVAASPVAPASASASNLSRTTLTHIAGTDGVSLSAAVLEPVTLPWDRTRFPLLVIPGPWAQPTLEQWVPAQALANDGYVVVLYTQRGFTGSGSTGTVTVGGPQDWADLSAVVDWSLAHTASDPARIGAAGVSFGGGTALLAAAHDTRIRSVASLSGWADIQPAFYPGGTRSSNVIRTLRDSGRLGGVLDPRADAAFEGFLTTGVRPWMLDYVAERSPSTYLSAYNARQVPILMEAGLNETVFPVDEQLAFFDRLTGPKRMLLAAGDHASNDAVTATLGVPSKPWVEMHAWFDATLKAPKPVTSGIQVTPRSPAGPRPAETFTSFGARATSRPVLALGPAGLGGSTSIGGAATSWQGTLAAGARLKAPYGGLPLVSYLAESVTGVPPTSKASDIDPRYTASWQTSPLAQTARLRGSVVVHVGLTPSVARFTVIAHVLDLSPTGTAYAVQHQPLTLRGQAGRRTSATITLPETAYDVPAGHRLVVCLSTWDALYDADADPVGSTVALDSRTGDAASVTIPLG